MALTWSSVASLPAGRAYFGQSVLPDGNALISGDITVSGNAHKFDRAANKWTNHSLRDNNNISFGLKDHLQISLANDKVLLINGMTLSNSYRSDILEYNFVTGTSIARKVSPGAGATRGCLLQDGRVLVITSDVIAGANAAIYLYTPSTDTWEYVRGFGSNPASNGIGVSLLLDGRVLITGGTESGRPSRLCSIFDPATLTSTRVADMPIGLRNHGQSTLPDGRVLITGGLTRVGSNDEPTADAYVYDKNQNTWTRYVDLPSPRAGHGQSTLPDGATFVVGGRIGSTNLSDVYVLPWNNAPTVTLTSPANDQNIKQGTDFNFKWAGSDPDGDTLNYTLQVGTSAGGSNIYNANVGSVTSKNGISTTWPMGLYYWRVIADDGKGGVTKSSEGTFIIYLSGKNPVIGRDGQGQVTYTFKPSSIIEQWTVPVGCERVQINVKGAKGGNAWVSASYPQVIGGKGGSVTANITITPGEILKLVVGRKGQDYLAGFGGGGGGGATSVIRTGNVPLVVAAGGGGAGAGGSSSAGNNGRDVSTVLVSSGGTGGTGGKGSTSHNIGAGGAGILNDGGDGYTQSNYYRSRGGHNPTTSDALGGSGGNDDARNQYGGSGGFGGGGGAGGSGGGGAGYTGGDGGEYGNGFFGGYGGRSYSIVAPLSSTLNANDDGEIIITVLNAPPTVTLTSPANNQTLTENSTYAVQGSATDVDSGNVVTVKYKINNGPTRALQSGVSNGSTPISFAKNLTFKTKRMWDGAVDVVGADLAENVNHTLEVWAEDDQGAKSAAVTRTFKVIWNRPPVISDSNRDLGILEAAPTVNYNVTDPESNPFTVTEKLNGVVVRTFAGVSGKQETFQITPDAWLKMEPGVLHTLTIEATDDQGAKSTRTYTLTRLENQISFEIETPWTTDVAAKRVLLTMDMSLPPGAVFVAEATNNAFDAAPVWEDISFYARYGRGYIFQNAQKTAATWGVSIRVRIEKGTATEPITVKGFGGAFD